MQVNKCPCYDCGIIYKDIVKFKVGFCSGCFGSIFNDNGKLSAATLEQQRQAREKHQQQYPKYYEKNKLRHDEFCRMYWG